MTAETTRRTRRRTPTTALLALVAIVFGVPWTSQVVSAQSQTLFVAFTEVDGVPITDMTPSDMVVEVDGEHSETLNLEPISWPVRLTVFVDNGIGSLQALDHMREGLRLFLDALPQDIDVAIGTTAERPQFTTARHTTDREELTDAIGVIAGNPEGRATYMDALYEEAERLQKDEEGQYFPVVVMVATNGPEGSHRVRQRPFGQMMERLFANKATVHTRLFVNPSVSGRKQGGPQIRWAIDIGEATGGTYEALSSPNGFRTLLPQLAEHIGLKHRLVSNQYRVTYAPPEGSSAQSSVRILTTRGAINMYPTRDGNIYPPTQDGNTAP